MVFKKGLALIATGTIAGLAAGLALTRLILLWGLQHAFFRPAKPRKWIRWSLCTTGKLSFDKHSGGKAQTGEPRFAWLPKDLETFVQAEFLIASHHGISSDKPGR